MDWLEPWKLTHVARCIHDGEHRFDVPFGHSRYNQQICVKKKRIRHLNGMTRATWGAFHRQLSSFSCQNCCFTNCPLRAIPQFLKLKNSFCLFVIWEVKKIKSGYLRFHIKMVILVFWKILFRHRAETKKQTCDQVQNQTTLSFSNLLWPHISTSNGIDILTASEMGVLTTRIDQCFNSIYLCISVGSSPRLTSLPGISSKHLSQ